MSLDVALATAAAGWPVFPAQLTEEGGKRPRLRGWAAEATTVGAIIRAWWDRWPDALVGVPTGEVSGLYVLDIDSLEAADVARSFGTKEERKRWRARPSNRPGGVHLYFHGGGPCRSVNGRLHPKLDVKGEGGFVVAWQPLPRPETLPPLPDAVRQAARRRGASRGSEGAEVVINVPVTLRAACAGVRSAREGTRNQTLNKWAWYLWPQVAAGLLDEAEWRCELVSAAVDTGYPADEAHDVLDNVKRRRLGE